MRFGLDGDWLLAALDCGPEVTFVATASTALQSWRNILELAVVHFCVNTNTVIPAKAGIQFVKPMRSILFLAFGRDYDLDSGFLLK
jgi:hypothetical protein